MDTTDRDFQNVLHEQETEEAIQALALLVSTYYHQLRSLNVPPGAASRLVVSYQEGLFSVKGEPCPARNTVLSRIRKFMSG
jgi:hypothetical protein